MQTTSYEKFDHDLDRRGHQCPGHCQQPTQTVKGRVIDAESQQPVIGAYVIVTSINPIIGGVTDTEGNFRIEKVPVGRHSFKITSVGYDDAFIQEINVGSGKEVGTQCQIDRVVPRFERGGCESSEREWSAIERYGKRERTVFYRRSDEALCSICK